MHRSLELFVCNVYNLVLKIIPGIQSPCIRAKSADVRFNPVCFGSSMHALVGSNPVRVIIYPTKKEGQLTLYFIADGNVYANLRGINVREKCISASLCVSVGYVRIYGTLKKDLRAFAINSCNFTLHMTNIRFRIE